MIRTDNPNTTPILEAVVEDSYKRLIAPAIEREIRSDLTEKAEDGSIKVFGKNLEQLLMQPPIVGKVVLGWDPAFRTGCKLAVVDETGKVLDTTVVYPTAPTTEAKIKAAKETVKKMIEKYHIDLISHANNGVAFLPFPGICKGLLGMAVINQNLGLKRAVTQGKIFRQKLSSV